MANDVDIQTRTKIGAIIQVPYPTAVIYPWNALSHDIAEWPGMFRTSDGKTFGYIVKRAEQSSEWKNAVRDRRFPVYDVWGFYGYRSGKLGDNSDDEFAIIRDTVYEALKAAPTLNFDGTVERHELLQLVRLTTVNCGEETLHFSQERLRVQLCC